MIDMFVTGVALLCILAAPSFLIVWPLRVTGNKFLLKLSPLNYKGHQNKGNDQQLEKLLIAKDILLVSNLGNVYGKVCWGLNVLNQS